MKRWLLVVLISAAAVAVWALPPSSLESPEARARPEDVHVRAVEREVGRANGLLRTLRWSDSLVAVLLAAPRGDLVVGRPAAAGFDAEKVDEWERTARRELAGLEPRDPRVTVGAFWQPMALGAVPGLPLAARGREITYVGERDGRPYCFRALPYAERSNGSGLDYLDGLGSCRLYASYGLPGARIQEWLDASALGFARVDNPGFAAAYARQLGEPRPTTLFGLARPPLSDGGLTVQSCLAGRPEACARALTDPAVIAPSFGEEAWLVAHSPASSFAGSFASPPFGYLDDALLYELEGEFGPEAFSGFWTSSAPVAQAFEEAFGEPLGVWVSRWVETHVGLYRAGPSLPWSATLWSLLALGALAGLSTRAARRRRVG